MPCKTKDPTPKSGFSNVNWKKNVLQFIPKKLQRGFRINKVRGNIGKSGASSYGLAMWSFSSLPPQIKNSPIHILVLEIITLKDSGRYTHPGKDHIFLAFSISRKSLFYCPTSGGSNIQVLPASPFFPVIDRRCSSTKIVNEEIVDQSPLGYCSTQPEAGRHGKQLQIFVHLQ